MVNKDFYGYDQRVCTARFLRESLFVRDDVGRYGCLTVSNRSVELVVM